MEFFMPFNLKQPFPDKIDTTTIIEKQHGEQYLVRLRWKFSDIAKLINQHSLALEGMYRGRVTRLAIKQIPTKLTEFFLPS